MFVFVFLISNSLSLHGSISFSSYDANIAIKNVNSKLVLDNPSKVTGWSEFSIHKKTGKNAASQWVEQYPNGVVISQEGSQEPTTMLVISNSNALNYGIKNNSNAIAAIRAGVFTPAEKQETLDYVRTTSNAFLYCCKNTSNALIFGVKNNSTALVNWPGGYWWSIREKEKLYETIRVNSNAFVYCCKNTSNTFVNAFTVYDTHQIYTDDTTEKNYVYYKAGFTVTDGKTLTLDIPTPVSGEINLSDTGVLFLQSDMHVASNAYLSNGGIINGDGNSLVLSCNFTIPENQVLRISGDTIINGHGTTITLEPHAQITVDNNVTLTIKNARILNMRNSQSDPMVYVSGTSGCLALQNVELALTGDYYFSQGHMFVHDDVIISGTSSLVYTSEQISYIDSGATWGFDQDSRFVYNPSVSNNALIYMSDQTANLYLNGAILQAGDMGIRLSKGALYLDNRVTLSCPTSTIIFGDSSLSNGDFDVHALAAARVEVIGSILDDSL